MNAEFVAAVLLGFYALRGSDAEAAHAALSNFIFGLGLDWLEHNFLKVMVAIRFSDAEDAHKKSAHDALEGFIDFAYGGL